MSVNVLTWHNDLTRQGLNSAEKVLTPDNVNTSTFGRLWSYSVQGQIYAQPLYVSNLSIPDQGTHNVVFVATQHNDVYAFDADSNAGANGGLLWHVNLGPSATVPNPFFGNRYGPYRNISPEVGITSTPVIDLATNTMYIDAFTNDVVGEDIYSHHIWALDISTGQQKTAPALVAAAVQGDGAGGVDGTITFTAKKQLQRSALTLLDGTLYVAYAGYADTDPYHGWVLGFDPATLELTRLFNTTPNASTDLNAGEGGIWQSGAGLSSDGARLYFMTGNGDFQPDIGDYGDSFVQITPDSSAQPDNQNGYGLSATDYFTPYNEQALADADADLGSGGTMLLPDQPGAHPHLLIGAGKQGIIYVVDRDAMGQFDPSADNVVQKVSLGHGVWSSPAYFNNTIYYHAVGDVLKAYRISNGMLSAAPIAQGTATYGYPGATPSVSADGFVNGIVWDVRYSSSHAVLRAYDATNLVELYNSNQELTRDELGAGVKFITPTIADGRVFVGTAGALAVFGLLAPPTMLPAAPSDLAASALGPYQIQLTWLDNSADEAGFRIERSLDNASFTEIGMAGASATSYVDGTADPATTYHYRIRATNIIGDSAYTSAASATTPALADVLNLYHFDEGSGTMAADSVGTNDGTLIGTTMPIWVAAGRLGAALSFSGDGVFRSASSQSAVELADDLAPVLGGTATIAAWIKTNQVGDIEAWASPAIMGVEVDGSTDDIRWGYLDASGHIGIGAGNSGLISSTAINDDQWHHVAFTRDSVTGAVQIFVDGILDSWGTSDTGLKSSPFRLIGAQSYLTGGLVADGATYFNGQLDDVRVYGQVLSANDIAGMARIPEAPTLESATVAAGPVVHLTFSNTSNYAQNLEVYRKVGAGGTYEKIATLADSATMYDDANVMVGTQYFYIVKATNLAGASPASNELSATPPAPTIVGSFIFYNDSNYDGNDGSSNVPDYLAIAPDKQALLPGQTATFQNYTSYSKGINGIIIDVADLDELAHVEDFIFRVGNNDDPATWDAAPTPTYVNAYPGRGPGGSTQITIIWPDNAIQNEWLQVTMPAESHLGLPAAHVFYFGNAIGESGNAPNDAAVDSADELRTRANFTAPGGAAIDNRYDYNRDQQVDVQDQLIARAYRSGLLPLHVISTPAAASSSATTTVEVASATSATTAAPTAVASGMQHSPAPSAPVVAEPAFGDLSRRSMPIDVAIRNLYAPAPPATRPVHLLKVRTELHGEPLPEPNSWNDPGFANLSHVRNEVHHQIDEPGTKSFKPVLRRKLPGNIQLKLSKPALDAVFANMHDNN